MKNSITMTAAQTAIYDGGECDAQRQMMRSLLADAQRLADIAGQMVEIYSADGIVIDYRYPAAS